ncbi:DNA methylase [Arthrobacter phage Galaxy]|uniref:DNA methylase n=1 Tax=Arthrobacter phage Galaxy TaxID=1772326 RepID=A0A0U4IU80_9CAUD|nr:DNA methyltransferase [Arthrobacter phage Galaxy]ALY08887.1 DNA methylase [Arthrobacter phage Galaxy]
MREAHYSNESVTLYAGDCLEVLRDLPDNSVDSVVTDPPYGLGNTTPALVAETVTAWLGGDREFIPEGRGFMGRPWDAFVPPVAVWDECLRVLKPGGHCLAFSGSRTLDLMTLGLRFAGFDIRDSIMWLYGSGFPKNRDVSAAMGSYLAGDRPESGAAPEVYEVTRFLKAARDAAGWTNRRIDEHFGTNGMAGHWTTQGSQPSVPSLRQWGELRDLLGFDDSAVLPLVERLCSTERPEDWGQGEGDADFLGSLKKNVEYSSAGGWGTALKPSFEPVVVARKPVIGSITANVGNFGTGAFNLAGCRTGEEGGEVGGRWPANVVLDESQAEELDRVSNEKPAQFFPVFRYEPKAPTSERPRVNGVSHPTGKPLELMRWLCRLVTPPGGVVLEPFAGSGTTLEAATLENLRAIGVERQPEYLPLIASRFDKPLEPVFDFGGLL